MRYFCSIVFLLFFLSVAGQEYLQTHRQYNLDQGLETRNIRSTFKDSRGFMWIATDIGAYRFDGFEFRLFKRNRKNNVPFAVERISEDAEKNLWFQHFNYNENVVDISILPNNQDTLLSLEDFYKGELPFPIHDAYHNVPRVNSNNGIWIISQKSKEIFEYVNGLFVKLGVIPEYDADSNSASKHFCFLDKDPEGTNWMVYQGYLYRATPKNGFEKFQKIPNKSFALNIDKSGRFWFVYKNEIYVKVSKDAPITKPAFLDHIDVDKIADFKPESITDQFIVANLGSINKMLLINHQTNEVLSVGQSLDDPLNNITPSHIFVDDSNTIWVSTYEGVFQTCLQKNPFKKLLQGRSTRGIIRGNDDELWIASYGGFFGIDTDSGKERLISKDINFLQNAYLDSKNNYFFGGPFDLFHKMADVAPFQAKLEQRDVNEGTVFQFYEHPNDNQLWAATEFGLFIFNNKENRILPYKKLNEFDEIRQSTVYDFEPLDAENFLVATSIGIFQVNLQDGIVNRFCSDNNNFPYDFISYIQKDTSDDTFWVGTKMGGLIHWNFSSGTFTTLNTEDGLSDNTIYAIYPDQIHKEYLWLPSNNGLMHFNKITHEVTNYKVEDGIVHDEFNFHSHFADEDGTLYFGGIQGVTSLHPKDFNVSKPKPKLHIAAIEFLNKENSRIAKNSILTNETKPILLKTSDKNFKVSVILTDYTAPEACTYYSKIDKIDNNWVPMNGNSILINGLSAGYHNIAIKAKNSKGIWAENQIVIPVRMLPPFYYRWWFIGLSALALFGLVLLFVRRRTYVLEKDKENLEQEVARRTKEIEDDKKLIEKQTEELKQLDEIKSRFFSNVTHELRTPLTLIIGPLQQLLKSEVIKEEKVRKTLLSVAENGTHLKQLVEEILDLNRLDASKIVLTNETIHFPTVIDKWINKFNPQSEYRNIQFKLEYGATTNLYLNIDLQKLNRIVINLLANAFKYSESGDTIWLRILEEPTQMKIEVEDSGLGIHEDDLPHIFNRFFQSKKAATNIMGGLGIGLALSKELAELMKGSISVKSELNKGSIFTFVFPKEKSTGKNVSRNSIVPNEVLSEERIEVVGARNRYNILIVEDNMKMQEFVIELLSPIANIQTANNGKKALDLLEASKTTFDLIVCDVMMPEMDGFTLLKLLREKKEWQLIPFVFLTARTNKMDKIKAYTYGVDDYMVKPFDPDELVARVRNLLIKIDERNELTEVSEIQKPVESNEVKKEFELINEFRENEPADFKWLKEIEQIAIDNIGFSNFNVSQFAFKVHLGERQLGRKLKKLTGLTPGNYLKEIRLQKARNLLDNKVCKTVAEVAFKVGFTTPEYFSKIFKKRFGKSPTEYTRNMQEN